MNFIWIIGPPAVGKMAVALEICKKTGYKMLHNHGSIELLLPIFPWGHPKFSTLNNEFRRRIFEEVATSDLPGFLFTYVTDFDDEKERGNIEKPTKIFKDQGHSVWYVELYALQSIRLERNKTPLRLDAKPSKRDTKQSDEKLKRWDEEYLHMNSSKSHPFFFQENYIKIDNSNLTAEEVADKVISGFGFKNQMGEI